MSKIKIKLVCPKCSGSPEKDEKKSNKNWMVFNSKCEKCKVRYKFVVS